MKLIINSATSRHLDQLVQTPGGSFLIHGAAGVGKRTAALDVGRQMNCAGCSDATCASCRMAQAGNHPDITQIWPDEKGKIGIDAIHQLIHQFTYTQYGVGTRRVAIIARGETMTVPAQNALLKLLEEPPIGTTIIITASSLSGLLDTIVSRCRHIYQPSQTARQITEHLTAVHGVASQQAAVLASMSGGAIGRAVTLAKSPEMVERLNEMGDEATTLLEARQLFDRLVAAGTMASQSSELDQYVDILSRRARVMSAQAGNAVALAAVQRLRDRLRANVSAKVAFEALAVETC